MHLGINSEDQFEFGLVEHVLFGPSLGVNNDYTVIARLVTAADGVNCLEGWGFSSDAVPAVLLKPNMTAERDYGGSATEIHFGTGNHETLKVTFTTLGVGTTAEAVLSEDEPEPQAFEHNYRPLRHLRVADHGSNALPIYWSYVSLLPTVDGPPDVLLSSRHPWLPDNTFLYQAASTGAAAEPEPNPRLPLCGPRRTSRRCRTRICRPLHEATAATTSFDSTTFRPSAISPATVRLRCWRRSAI